MTALPVGALTHPPTRPPQVSVGWRVLAIAAPLLAAATTVWVAWNAGHPSFPFDELDQFQMSRLILGLDTPRTIGAGYYPLWSFLLAPIWLFTSDPFVFYSATIAIGVVVGLSTIAPLAHLARRLRLTREQSVTAASIVVTMPAVVIQADYGLSERLLFLMVALTTLTAWRLWERPGYARAVLFASVVAAMYFTHARMLAVVLAAAAWLLLFLLRNWRVGIVAFVTLVALVILADWSARYLNTALLGDFSQGENLLATLRASRPGLLLRSALGQAWTQIVGSFGLVAVGLVAVVRWSWFELRRLRAGRATFVLALVASSYLLTVIKWASDYHLYTRPWRRLDVWLYGRYLDPVAILLVLIALGLIIRGIRRAPVLWAGTVSIAVMVPTVFWVALDAPTWGYVTPAHIPGVMPWWWTLPAEPFPDGERIVPTLFNEDRFWVIASLCTLAVLALLLLLRRRALLLTAGLAVLFAASSVVADGASDHFHEIEGTPPAAISGLRSAIAEAGGASVAFDVGCDPNGGQSAVTQNYFGYWLLPEIIETFNSAKRSVTPDVVISCQGVATPPGVPDDAVLVPDSAFLGHEVWVRPGRVSDALQAAGDLP